MISSLTFWSSFRTSSRISCRADGKQPSGVSSLHSCLKFPTQSFTSEVSEPSPRGMRSSRVFRPPGQETAFTEASRHPVLRVAYLLGPETRLDCSPRGLGFHVPLLSQSQESEALLELNFNHFNSKEEGCFLFTIKTFTCFIFSKSDSSTPPESLLLPAGFAL